MLILVGFPGAISLGVLFIVRGRSFTALKQGAVASCCDRGCGEERAGGWMQVRGEGGVMWGCLKEGPWLYISIALLQRSYT